MRQRIISIDECCGGLENYDVTMEVDGDILIIYLESVAVQYCPACGSEIQVAINYEEGG
ncbi:MAG: hypothetical protein GY833_16550 [Aestuariibacter sp.]|nr:hypothetical protein [Aestuariibacter sp.]